MNSYWHRIAEAFLHELTELYKEISLLEEIEEKDRLLFYAELQILFYRYEPGPLQNFVESKQEFLKQNRDLAFLAKSCLLIRSKGSYEMIHDLEMGLEILNDPFFKGQLLQAIGFGLAMLKEFEKAEKVFLHASANFEKAQLLKEALRAHANSLWSRSCHNTSGRLFGEYSVLYEKAKSLGAERTAGYCLMAISKELQVFKAYSLALDYADQGIEIYEKQFVGSYAYSSALLQRADLLFQMERKGEAQRDLYFANLNPDRDVQYGAQLLAEKYGVDLLTLNAEQTVPTWDFLKTEESPSDLLTKLEAQIIFILSRGPVTRHQLIEQLYGDKIDFLSAEGRLKNLLFRLRKKFPNHILFENDTYRLIDQRPTVRIKKQV